MVGVMGAEHPSSASHRWPTGVKAYLTLRNLSVGGSAKHLFLDRHWQHHQQLHGCNTNIGSSSDHSMCNEMECGL